MQPSHGALKESFDVLVVGAGPTGLACAIEAQRAGLRTVLVDKGCLCNSLFHYPSNMTFFTTPELLEIGDMPFSSPNQKPSRNEALEYYRKVAEHYQLEFRQYQNVSGVTGEDGDFTITTIDRYARHRSYGARKVIIATGYYDLPNYLEVPGEELTKVLHYYHDPHPFYDQNVLVIGGKNSAAIAALDLWRHGAHVTLVHRGEDAPPRQILDPAGHQQSHQERRSCCLVFELGGQHPAGLGRAAHTPRYRYPQE